MSIHCSERVWEHSEQKGAALLLLLAIADYADRTGFAWPGLGAVARKTRLSSRHVSRLIANLQSAGELLVLPRPGRSHLYIVLTGTARELLAAALQRAADRSAVVDSLLDATLDRLSGVCPSSSSASPAACTTAIQDSLSSQDRLSFPTDDIAMSSPTPDKLSSPPDNFSSPPDKLSSPHDIAMSSDPSLSGIDPSVNERWQTALNGLSLCMTSATFDHCLRGSRVIHLQDNVWTVQIVRPLALDWLEHRLAGRIRHTLTYFLPGIQVRFAARNSAQTVCTTPAAQSVAPEPASSRNTQQATRLRSGRNTFYRHSQEPVASTLPALSGRTERRATPCPGTQTRPTVSTRTAAPGPCVPRLPTDRARPSAPPMAAGKQALSLAEGAPALSLAEGAPALSLAEGAPHRAIRTPAPTASTPPPSTPTSSPTSTTPASLPAIPPSTPRSSSPASPFAVSSTCSKPGPPPSPFPLPLSSPHPTFVSGLCSLLCHHFSRFQTVTWSYQPKSTQQIRPSTTIVSQIYFPLLPAPLIIRRPLSPVLRPASFALRHPSVVHHPPPDTQIHFLPKGRNRFIMLSTRCPMPAPGMGIPKGTS